MTLTPKVSRTAMPFNKSIDNKCLLQTLNNMNLIT